MKLIHCIVLFGYLATRPAHAAPADDILALQKVVAVQAAQIAQLKLDKQKSETAITNLIKNQNDLLTKVNNRFNQIAISTQRTDYSDAYVARFEINGGFTHSAVHCGSGVVSDFRFWLNPGGGALPQFDRAGCTSFSISRGADITLPQP